MGETVEMAVGELGEALSSMRLCPPQCQRAMQLSLSQLGQLTPVSAYRLGQDVEIFDGLKRLRAARQMSWSRLRVELHALDRPGAKVRMLCCNQSGGLAELEEAWLVRSLYREDQLSQPQIAMLLSRHKSWVCRRLALAEGLSDELTAQVRLGLVPATAAAHLARLQRSNQDEVTGIVVRRGLTTRQTALLVQRLLATPQAQWPTVLEQAQAPSSASASATPCVTARRTPAEQLVADASTIKRAVVRLHARLVERSLLSLGEAASAVVAEELSVLRSSLATLVETLDKRIQQRGQANGR